MTRAIVLISTASEATSTVLTPLSVGIHYIEVVGDLGAASVQIQQTLDPTNLSNFKNIPDLVLTEGGVKMGVVRGGAYIRAVVTGNPAETIQVLVQDAST